MMLKKSISVILAIILAVSVFTVAPLTVYAEEIQTDGDYQYAVVGVQPEEGETVYHTELVKYTGDGAARQRHNLHRYKNTPRKTSASSLKSSPANTIQQKITLTAFCREGVIFIAVIYFIRPSSVSKSVSGCIGLDRWAFRPDCRLR